MLLKTLLPPEVAFFVATAGSAKTFQKRNVSSGAAVQTVVPSGLCDMCSALAVCPVSSPTCSIATLSCIGPEIWQKDKHSAEYAFLEPNPIHGDQETPPLETCQT